MAVTVLLALTACGGSGATTGTSDSASSGQTAGATNPSVAHVVAGTLGDQGFFDDAERGIQALAAAGSKTTTVQADANNPAQWKSNLESVSTGTWGLVVTGTSQMKDILTATAPKYPNQNYIYYDDIVKAPNVASITYKQNEGSYLAGVLAAEVTLHPDQFPRAKGSKVVGLVGGMDIPVINDFVAGFKSGVKTVDPSIKVVVSYVGGFNDSNKGYDQAKAMFDREHADVVFQVAGGSGLGVLKAAQDADRYAIGVDSNQNAINKGYVLASMLKNIGASIKSAVMAYAAGTLKMGSVTPYGLANNGVSLTFENNGNIVPKAIQDLIASYAQKVVAGQVTVGTAF